MEANPAAAVVVALDETAQRVGSKGSMSKGEPTYALSTMEARHVKVRGKIVTFDYIAKSGKRYKQSHNSQRLASVVRAFLVGKDGYEKPDDERLFPTSDDTVRTYMRTKSGALGKKEKPSPHGYRYLWATNIAIAMLERLPTPKTRAAARRIKKQVCTEVGAFLSNSPAQAYDTYINPIVWKDWGDDIAPAPPKLDKSANVPTLAKAEQLLAQEADVYIWPDFGANEVTGTMDEILPDESDYVDPTNYLIAIGESVRGKSKPLPPRASDGRWGSSASRVSRPPAQTSGYEREFTFSVDPLNSEWSRGMWQDVEERVTELVDYGFELEATLEGRVLKLTGEEEAVNEVASGIYSDLTETTKREGGSGAGNSVVIASYEQNDKTQAVADEMLAALNDGGWREANLEFEFSITDKGVGLSYKDQFMVIVREEGAAPVVLQDYDYWKTTV